MDEPYSIFAKIKEPDLTWMVKEYLPVSEGPRQFQTIGHTGSVATNDYEQWKDQVDIPAYINPNEQDEDDIFQPFDKPPYARDQLPFGSGVGEFLEPATTVEKSSGLYDSHPATTASPREGFVGDLPSTVSPREGFIGFGDVANMIGMTYTPHPGLGALPNWMPFKFGTFPGMDKVKWALDRMKKLPDFFTRTKNELSRGVALPKFTMPSYRLDFPSIAAPIISKVKDLKISTSSMAGKVKDFNKLITATKFNKIRSNYISFLTDIAFIKTNLPSDSYSTTTNLKRMVRILAVIAKGYKQSGKTYGPMLDHQAAWMTSSYDMIKGSFELLKKFSDGVVSTFTDLPSKINTNFKSAVDRVKSGVNSVISSLKTTGTKYSANIKKYVTDVITYSNNYLKKISTQIKDWVGRLTTAIRKDTEGMVSWIVSRLRELSDGILEDFTKVKNWTTTNMTNFGNNIKKNVTNIGNGLSKEVKDKLAVFSGEISKAKSDLTNQFNTIISKSKKDLEKYVGGIQTSFKAKVDNLEKSLTAKYQTLKVNIDTSLAEVKALTGKVTKLSDLLDSLKAQSTLQQSKMTQMDEGLVSHSSKLVDLESKINQLLGQKEEKKGGFAFPWS